MRAAAKLSAVLAALASFAFVAGVALPPRAALATMETLKAGAMYAAPAGLLIDCAVLAIGALILIRRRSK